MPPQRRAAPADAQPSPAQRRASAAAAPSASPPPQLSATGSTAQPTSETLFVFAHGAGAPSTHPWMTEWATRLERLGRVHRFDYAYMRGGARRAPDAHAVLVRTHAEAVREALDAHPSAKHVFLIGKSMGSRIGLHVTLENEAVKSESRVRGCICLGYPLRGANGALRDKVLHDMQLPVLFVSGTRDALCPLADLEAARKKMRAPTVLHIVNTGDHSLAVLKKTSGTTQGASDEAVFDAIASFVAAHTP